MTCRYACLHDFTAVERATIYAVPIRYNLNNVLLCYLYLLSHHLNTRYLHHLSIHRNHQSDHLDTDGHCVVLSADHCVVLIADHCDDLSIELMWCIFAVGLVTCRSSCTPPSAPLHLAVMLPPSVGRVHCSSCLRLIALDTARRHCSEIIRVEHLLPDSTHILLQHRHHQITFIVKH